MTRHRTHPLLACILAAALGAPALASDAPAREPERLMEIAICLDTSGSMEGLIDSARHKLWAIVNDLATSAPTPRLRLALVTFGNDGHAEENGWVRVDTDFTEDLDLVSQQLFALATNGGTELVGRVMKVALENLTWTGGERDLKLMFVCGNESAEQDTVVPFRDMSRKAIGAGIMVNSIYCGPATDELAPAWQDVSRLADGHFASIDQNKSTFVIATPFDEAMAALSGELNTTYIPVGASGAQAWANQQMQDDNALGLSGAAAATRAQTKCATVYSCSWDLVDALQGGTLDWEKIKPEDLPEAMRTMTPEERVAHVEAQAKKRADLQERVKKIGEQRDAFVVEERARQGLDETDSFDRAVRTAVRSQAETLGFVFAAAAAPPELPLTMAPATGSGLPTPESEARGIGAPATPEVEVEVEQGTVPQGPGTTSRALRDRVGSVLQKRQSVPPPAEVAFRAIEARLSALSPQQRDVVTAAAGTLAQDCPHTQTYLELVPMLDDAVRGEEAAIAEQVQDTRLRHLLASQEHLLGELRRMAAANRRLLVDLGVASAATEEPTPPMTVDAAAATTLHTRMRAMRDTVAALPTATREGLDEARAVFSKSLGNFPFKEELLGIRERLDSLATDSATIRRLAVTSTQEDPQLMAAILDRQRRLDDGTARLQLLFTEFFRIFC